MKRTIAECFDEEMRLYREARGEWMQKRDTREELRTTIRNLQSSKEYKPEVLRQKLNEANKKYSAANSDMLNVGEKLRRNIKALREEMREAVYNKISGEPEQIDNRTLSLLKSGSPAVQARFIPELDAFDSIADISYKAVGCSRGHCSDYSDTADKMAEMLEGNAQQIIDKATT